MTKEQRIEAAQKRIKELELLIKDWSKKWRYILDVSGRDLELIKSIYINFEKVIRNVISRRFYSPNDELNDII